MDEEQRVSRGFRCDTGDIAAKRVTLEILLSAGFVVPSVDVIDHERREPLAFGRVIQPPGSVPKTRRRGLLHDQRRCRRRDENGVRSPDALSCLDQRWPWRPPRWRRPTPGC